MLKKAVIPILLILAALQLGIMLTGCAGISSGREVIPTRLELNGTLQLPFQPGKVLLDEITGTYFILEAGKPYLHFWRNGTSINTLGGFGSEKSNFQKLSDITLDPDGNLLALDSFARLVRKFTPDGKWIADTELADFSQPTKICATAGGDLIVYDDATQEFTKLSALDSKPLFSFGRFQVDSVSHISASRDYIASIDETGDQTVVFSALGQFLDEYKYQLVLDRFQNLYIYHEGALRLLKEDVLLPFGWDSHEVKLFASPETLLLVRGESVLTILPSYAGE